MGLIYADKLIGLKKM